MRKHWYQLGGEADQDRGKKPEIKLQDAYFALYSKTQAEQMLDANYNALTVTKKPDKHIEQDGATWYLKSVDKTGADGT